MLKINCVVGLFNLSFMTLLLHSVQIGVCAMKALLYNPHELGKVTVGERPIPKPNTGEVVIRIRAASLNHRDLYVINGQMFPPDSPIIVGSDASGTIHSLGDGVHGWAEGDEVTFNPGFACRECVRCMEGDVPNCEHHTALGGPGDGVIAEYAVVHSNYLVRKPTYLSFEETAALPMALGTAWRSLISKGGLKSGETVLIQGIGGGVAYIAMQLALTVGAKVIVTSSSDEKLRHAINAGASAGVNYLTEDVVAKVMELTQGVGVDVSLETGGRATLPFTLSTLKRGGRIVLVGSSTGPVMGQTPMAELAKKELSLIFGQMPSQPDLETALQYYTEHQLHPPVMSGYTLECGPKAFEDYAKYKQLGKVVLTVE